MASKSLEVRIEELEQELAELQARWPAHSVPPALMAQLDELEDALAAARRELNEGEG